MERRVGQRFPYLLPLSSGSPAPRLKASDFTQDLSSRGVFFFTDAALTEGAEIELTLHMPSEITLGESMPVRCRGSILRVVRPHPQSAELRLAEKRQNRRRCAAGGLRIFNRESDSSATFPRVHHAASLIPPKTALLVEVLCFRPVLGLGAGPVFCRPRAESTFQTLQLGLQCHYMRGGCLGFFYVVHFPPAVRSSCVVEFVHELRTGACQRYLGHLAESTFSF